VRSGYAMPVKDNVCPDGEDDAVVSDNDLLAAVAEGDRDSFAVLMKRYLVPMVALAYRIVLDREQAREIAQEAFLRVWKHAHKWDPDGSATFLTWLRRVTTNLAISRRRRFRPEVTLDAIEDLPSTYTDGFYAVAEADNKRLVEKAMAVLPERQRAAVALYYFDELPQAEAAEVMQLSLKAFGSLIIRARENLKKALAGSGFEKGDAS